MSKIPEDDWRRQGQESYLSGKSLMKRTYSPWSETWTHDHCEFCQATLSENGGDLNEGYCTLDQYHWICNACFDDFKSEYDWTVVTLH